MTNETRYDLMTSDQVPPDVLAQWLADPDFLAYVRQRQGASA